MSSWKISRRQSVALAIALAGCNGDRFDTQADLAASASGDQEIACAGDTRASDAVAFTTVDLGELARLPADRPLSGPRTRAVIRDSADWPRVWRQAVDSAPPPCISFGKDALILVATRTYTVGPTHLVVEAVRRCRRSGALVIAVRETGSRGGGEDVSSRGFQVIRVKRADLAQGAVSFVDLRSADP